MFITSEWKCQDKTTGAARFCVRCGVKWQKRRYLKCFSHQLWWRSARAKYMICQEGWTVEGFPPVSPVVVALWVGVGFPGLSVVWCLLCGVGCVALGGGFQPTHHHPRSSSLGAGIIPSPSLECTHRRLWALDQRSENVKYTHFPFVCVAARIQLCVTFLGALAEEPPKRHSSVLCVCSCVGMKTTT